MDDAQALILSDLVATARTSVAAGFMSKEDILETLVDQALDEDFEEDDELLEKRLAAILEGVIQAHQQAQATWPAITDFDRLETAFQTLQNKGIVVRHDFSCCGSCGSGEILDEMAQERAAGKQVLGYVFYHEQDTEGAVYGRGLYFNYGPAFGGELDCAGVGSVLAEALRDAGLRVEWNGKTSTRVCAEMDWKRRVSYQ